MTEKEIILIELLGNCEIFKWEKKEEGEYKTYIPNSSMSASIELKKRVALSPNLWCTVSIREYLLGDIWSCSLVYGKDNDQLTTFYDTIVEGVKRRNELAQEEALDRIISVLKGENHATTK